MEKFNVEKFINDFGKRGKIKIYCVGCRLSAGFEADKEDVDRISMIFAVVKGRHIGTRLFPIYYTTPRKRMSAVYKCLFGYCLMRTDELSKG